jgi:hypothetical protein
LVERPIARIALVLLFTAFVVTGEASFAGPIVVAWDPSPDPQVVGYRVFVGTAPGIYTETFDVDALTTSFQYGPKEARVYYFAVSSYAAGSVVGVRSAEVSSFGSPTGGIGFPDPGGPGAAPDADSYWRSLWASAAAPMSLSPQAAREPAPTECSDASGSRCEPVHTLLTSPAPITSPAATNDGRLFFIESGRRLQVMTSDALVGHTVLAADNPAVTLTHVVVDPAFAETGVLYLGEIETTGNGSRQFRVVRYRVQENAAGERVTLVHGIPLTASGEPHLAIDTRRRLHISVPSAAISGAESLVLRLNTDGTVPPDNPGGSPVVAKHPGALAAIAWVSDRLWLFHQHSGTADSNAGRGLASARARAALRDSEQGRALVDVVAFTARELADGSRELLALRSDGTFSRTPIDVDGVAGLTRTLAVDRRGVFGGMTTDPQGVAYVAVTNRSLRGVTSSILRIGPPR